MFSSGQDPDVVRWGQLLFDSGPSIDNSYSSYGPQNYTDCYQYQYSTENHYEKDHLLPLAEDTSASTDSCESVDHSQVQPSFYLQDSLNQSMANCSLGDDEISNDMPPCESPTSQLNYGEELSYSLELSDEYALDDEVENRLNHMASVPHIPKVNGEIPSLDEATLDHQRLLDRLQLYQLVESKVIGDGNCQFRAISDQVYHTAEHHKFVRQQIVNQLELYSEIYEGYVPMDYGDYLKNMAKVGEWGDHVTLQAAADLYAIKICVITSYKDTCYIEIVPSVQRSNRVILLSFWAEVHYNSIYPVEDVPQVED